MQYIYIDVPEPAQTGISLVDGKLGPTKKTIIKTDSSFKGSGGLISWTAKSVQASYTVGAYKASDVGTPLEETPSFSYSGKDEAGELPLPAGSYYVIKAWSDTENGARLLKIYVKPNGASVQNIYINVPDEQSVQGIYFNIPD